MKRQSAKLGISADLAAFARCGLIAYEDIFTHQRDALAALPGREERGGNRWYGLRQDGIVPPPSCLLAHLRVGGLDWYVSLRDHAGGTSAAGWTPQRGSESGRAAAIRALVLYPMNALVEDQLVRLRRALDSPEARRWLDSNRGGHRFYFGRYTGATPVAGDSANAGARNRLKRYLTDITRSS